MPLDFLLLSDPSIIFISSVELGSIFSFLYYGLFTSLIVELGSFHFNLFASLPELKYQYFISALNWVPSAQLVLTFDWMNSPSAEMGSFVLIPWVFFFPLRIFHGISVFPLCHCLKLGSFSPGISVWLIHKLLHWVHFLLIHWNVFLMFSSKPDCHKSIAYNWYSWVPFAILVWRTEFINCWVVFILFHFLGLLLLCCMGFIFLTIYSLKIWFLLFYLFMNFTVSSLFSSFQPTSSIYLSTFHCSVIYPKILISCML